MITYENVEKPLCGKCKKPKGEGDGYCNCGRPTTYLPEYIDKVDEYLQSCKDEYVQLVSQANEEKGYEMYKNNLEVNLPSREGFSEYVDIAIETINGWISAHEEFSRALEKIDRAQKKKLMNSGLSGKYNPTIAKLILSANHGMAERTETKHSGELTWLNQAHEARQNTTKDSSA